jgi:hypothetical protein
VQIGQVRKCTIKIALIATKLAGTSHRAVRRIRAATARRSLRHAARTAIESKD